MIRLAISVFLSCLIAPEVPEVDPPDLARRADLVGRELVVDGRLKYFQSHPGRGFDEIVMDRTTVPFRLSESLRTARAPDARVVRAQGTLNKVGGHLVFDVESLRLLPEDQDRLERGVAALVPKDIEGRRSWARWARHRARLYGDKALDERARQLEAEAIHLEAETPAARSPEATLALARRARALDALDADLLAHVHRAFLLQARAATSPEELDRLAQEIAELLPAARQPSGLDVSTWKDRYEADPDATYRQAPETARKALDRRLWADVRQRELELRDRAHPEDGPKIAEQARTDLPDRPEFAAGLRRRALKEAARDVAGLRESELLDLARATREEFGAVESDRLKREWLQAQGRKLSPSDADGRVRLASQYQRLLDDETSAVDLLRAALKIDPRIKGAVDAFRRLGYRKDGENWVKAGAESGDDANAASTDDPMIGLTRDEVRSRLGAPNRISRSATSGQVTEQWIYQGLGPRQGAQSINFLVRPGQPATVIRRYVPR